MVNPTALFAFGTSTLALAGAKTLELAVDRTLTVVENVVLPYANPYTGAALLMAGGGYAIYRRYQTVPPIQQPVNQNPAPPEEPNQALPDGQNPAPAQQGEEAIQVRGEEAIETPPRAVTVQTSTPRVRKEGPQAGKKRTREAAKKVDTSEVAQKVYALRPRKPRGIS